MPTTLKVLKGNMGSFLKLGCDVSNVTLKAEVTKAEIDKWNGIELQSHSAAQGTIARVEDNLQHVRKYLQSIYMIRG